MGYVQSETELLCDRGPSTKVLSEDAAASASRKICAHATRMIIGNRCPGQQGDVKNFLVEAMDSE